MSQNKEKILGLAAALLAVIVAELGGAQATTEEDTSKGNKSGGTKTKETVKETKTEPEGPSLQDLRDKAQKLMADGKAPQIKKILAKFKTESLTKADASDYPAIAEALDALTLE